MHIKSQRRSISRIHEGGTPGVMSMKLGPLVYMVNIIIFEEFDHSSLIGLNLASFLIFHFPMLNLTAHTTGLALNALQASPRTGAKVLKGERSLFNAVKDIYFTSKMKSEKLST
jgi:hypothetical protein